MVHRIIAFAVALFLLIALPASAAEWAVRPAPAAGDLPAATITNDEGHTLYLWPKSGPEHYQIFAELHLGGGSAFADAMPRYRIDDGALVDTEAIREAGEREKALWGHVKGKVAFWRAWASTEDVIRRDDPFHAWLAGETLRLTYRTAGGGTATTSFPLAGLGVAVTEATGVKVP